MPCTSTSAQPHKTKVESATTKVSLREIERRALGKRQAQTSAVYAIQTILGGNGWILGRGVMTFSHTSMTVARFPLTLREKNNGYPEQTASV
jgi:hypothetical protein